MALEYGQYALYIVPGLQISFRIYAQFRAYIRSVIKHEEILSFRQPVNSAAETQRKQGAFAEPGKDLFAVLKELGIV